MASLPEREKRKITFCVFDPNRDGDPSPYVGLTPEKLAHSLRYMQNKDEVVIEGERIKLKIEYPLSRPALADLVSRGGFTRASLATAIAEAYQIIYKEEHESTGSFPKRLGPMLNRPSTDGKWGIWGHDLGDLDFTTVYEGDDGVWTLAVYS